MLKRKAIISMQSFILMYVVLKCAMKTYLFARKEALQIQYAIFKAIDSPFPERMCFLLEELLHGLA
jgi:hypothetical protein